MTHSFDTNIAAEYGVTAAVIFQNIMFWIEKNRANNAHFHDGKYWTYNSRKAFAEMFPYLTEKQIRNALDALVKSDMIIKGNYNELGINRTTWYALGRAGERYSGWATQVTAMKRETKCEVKQINGRNIPDYERMAELREQRHGTG